MKNPLLNKLCALALILMLAVPVLAQAEAIVLPDLSEDIASPMIESAPVETGSVSLTGPVVESNHTIEDEEEYELHSKTKSAKCEAGYSFTIDLGDDVYGKNWKSSNKKVAKVDNGYVTCLKAGTAKISVNAYDYDSPKKSATRTLTLEVKDSGKGAFTIVFDDEDAGDTYRFKDGETWNSYPGWNVTLRAERGGDEEDDVKWTTSKKKYVEIDSESGELKCLKPGKAKITAEAPNGMKASFYVNVKKNSGSTKLSKSQKQSEANREQDALIGVKSVSVASTTSVTVTFVFFNGTDSKIKKITGLDVSVDGHDSVHDGEMVSGSFSSVKVNCGKRSSKEFKLTFKGDDVQEAFWWLQEPAFDATCDASFSY